MALPWTDEELDGERTRCDALLAGLDIAYETQLPLREGRCGAAIPLKITSIGRNPAVSIGGTALLNCEMAAMLAVWIRDELQPAAISLLGSPVARLTSVSSYVCRNRYGSRDQPVSEHAFANAFDIASFETAVGQKITVLDHWTIAPPDIPLPLRKPTLVERGLLPSAEAAIKSPTPAEAAPSGTLVTPAVAGTREALQPAPAPEAPSGVAPRPVLPEAPPPSPEPPDPRTLFLRHAHKTACRMFGTVLGPEANAAHKDHFHLDLAERRHGNYCQ
ncbi:MAG: extensin family protein [Pseudomonadota bacterium]|nr:extensin family protein [Pseudomonadota bacterium]